MNKSDLASFHAIVQGKVQGVLFRASTLRYATTLGLTGWVRNLGIGVEVWAEGQRASLEKLAEWLHQGPRGAEVEKVEVSWSEYKGDFSSFEIIY